MHNKYSIDNLQLLSLSILNCLSDACKLQLYPMDTVYGLSPGELFPASLSVPPTPILNAFLYKFCKRILPFLCAQCSNYYSISSLCNLWIIRNVLDIWLFLRFYFLRIDNFLKCVLLLFIYLFLFLPPPPPPPPVINSKTRKAVWENCWWFYAILCTWITVSLCTGR